MKDYIYRPELLKRLRNSQMFNADYPSWVEGVINGMLDEDDDMGEWQHFYNNDKHFWMCSNCKDIFNKTDIYSYHYCPTCGKHMNTDVEKIAEEVRTYLDDTRIKSNIR